MITMIQGMVSARWLLPLGKGELTTIMLWPSIFVSFGILGIQDAVAFFTAKADAMGTREILASAISMMLLVSALLVGLGYTILPIILINKSSELIGLSLLYLWYIPPTLLTACLVGILIGKLKLLFANLLRVIVYVIILSTMIIFFIIKKVTVQHFTFSFLLASWVVFLLAIVFVYFGGWIGFAPKIDIIKKLLAYGLRVHLGSLAGSINLRLDQLLLSVFLPTSVLGLYVVAVTIGSGANLVASTIASWVAFPILINLPPNLHKAAVFGRFVKLSLVSSIISVVILYSSTPLIINLFFGPAYNESISMARILIIASIPLGCNATITSGLKSYNLPAISGYAEIVGLFVTIISLMILLPTQQALGAAWASLIAYSVTSLYLIKKTQEKLEINLEQLFLPSWDDVNTLKKLLLNLNQINNRK